jgi:surface antigen
VQTREYQTEITVGNEVLPAYGTACLQSDGSWKVISGPIVDE